MWNTLEPWQMSQLKRMANLDPERVETAMNALWMACPKLFEDLAISAVDQEALTVVRCAELLHVSEEEVMVRLASFRRQVTQATASVIQDDLSVARLAECHVAVWEIVREYRKLGDLERLERSFPSLARGELAAALKYADQNPAEIEQQIERYENLLTRRRTEYPFAR